jgi:hypothetical protein
MRVAIVAPPWRSIVIPAHQPPMLKAWLNQHHIAADAHHLYLDVAAAFGHAEYERLAEALLFEDLAQDATQAGLLFPDRRDKLTNFIRWAGVVGIDADFWPRWQASHDEAFGRIDWQTYDLAVITGNGVVSSPDCHFLAGIHAATRIKAAAPQVRTVLLGPDWAGQIGRTVLDVFDSVDHVINGEGESALLALIGDLQAGREPDGAGLLRRGTAVTLAEQLPDLDVLPTPDYDSYWQHPILATQQPLLRLEGARGCWWDRSYKDPSLSCQFCNINVEWRGYRARSIPRVIEDLQTLAARHDCRRFSFVDKVHRPKDSAALYEAIAETGQPWEFYAVDCRLAMPLAALHAMKRAGVKSVHFGVEALAPDLLKAMNKGATFGRIVEFLRTCTELEIAIAANIIVDYPGGTDADVAITVERLTWLQGLLPLQHSVLNLGYGSPLTTPGTPLKGIANSPVYRILLPETMVDRLELMHKIADRPASRADWSPVIQALQQWQMAYQTRPWAYRKEWQAMGDGHVVAVWYDQAEQPTARRLPPLPGKLLAACETALSWKGLQQAFPDEAEDDLKQALGQNVATGLMAEADGQWVTLALHPPGGLSVMQQAATP